MEYLPYGVAMVSGFVFAFNITRFTTWWWHLAPIAGMMVVMVFDPSRPTADSMDSFFYTCCAMFLAGQTIGFLLVALYQVTRKPTEPVSGRD